MFQSRQKNKIMVGMSGGVDSSVAAYLLKQQGYEVIGVFMQNWDNDDPYCSANQDLTDARSVCNKLDIPFKTVSFAHTYWGKVFQYFLDEYAAGRTPNPDIMCNKEIKFKAFLEYAIKQKADYIATGHYVRKQKRDGRWQLLRGIDNNKDQSYFLYALSQSQIANSLFPIGDYEKSEIRAIAKQQNFITHDKKDSTGICFIGERKFKDFLKEYLLAKPGDIETTQGKVIGQHNGLMYYTLGQRQGINIGGLRGAKEAPWYVLSKNIKRNVLIIGQDHNHPLLMSNQLICKQVHWISSKTPDLPLTCTAKTRYRQTDQRCTIFDEKQGQYYVKFDILQRAITPGQSIVFYQNEICLGGGIITERE